MAVVVISVNDGLANVWANQFVSVYTRRQKTVSPGGTFEVVMPRFNVPMGMSPTPASVISTVQSAVSKAGSGGTIIFNVGHGSTSTESQADGTVDLAPGRKFRLGGLNADPASVFVSVFYDFDPDGTGPYKSRMRDDIDGHQGAERKKRWSQYQKLSEAIKMGGLRKVVFLTCKVGGSSDFLKKIAMDWRVTVQAYTRQVQLTPRGSGRVRVHLHGDPDGHSTNVPDSEENLFSDVVSVRETVLFGPPL